MRSSSIVLAIVLVACVGPRPTHDPRPPGGAALELPRLPDPGDLPEHIAAKEHLDQIGVPSGARPELVDGLVCYGPDAHLRLALSLSSDERRSTARAKASWRAGWLACQGSHQPILLAEHERAIRAESAPPPAVDVGWWDTVVSASPWIAGAAVVAFTGGVLVGAAAGD